MKIYDRRKCLKFKISILNKCDAIIQDFSYDNLQQLRPA